MPIINWVYRAEAPDNVAAVKSQIRLAHTYRNKLIELEHTRRAAAKAFAKTLHPEYAEAENVLAVAQEALDEAYKTLRKSRQLSRTRHAPTDAQAAAIKAAAKVRDAASRVRDKARGEAWAAVKAAQKPFRDESKNVPRLADESDTKYTTRRNNLFYERAEAAGVDAGEAAHRRDLKTARQESKVYWGTSRVLEQASKTYRAGSPPRFRRWDDTGTIGVRFQGGINVSKIRQGNSAVLQINVPPGTPRLLKHQDRGEAAKGTMRFLVNRTDDGPVFATFPYVHHRDFPDDAKIIDGFVHLKRVGKKDYWEIRLTIKTEEPRSRVSGTGECVLHLGHRMIGDSLRCATSLDAEGNRSSLFVTKEDLKRFSRPDSLESVRDKQFNLVRCEFLGWLDTVEVPEWLQKGVETLALHRSPESLYTLVERWRDARFVGDGVASAAHFPGSISWARSKLSSPAVQKKRHPSDIDTVFGLMEFWRSWDRHIVQEAACTRKRVRRKRKQDYRRWLHSLANKYATIIIDSTDWSKLAKKEGDTAPVVLVSNQRRLARVASPGMLREFAVDVFGGKNVKVVPSVNMTRTCASCRKITTNWDASKLDYTCEHCGTVVDQDLNAATIMLSRSPEALNFETYDEDRKKAKQEKKAKKKVTVSEN